MRRLFLIFLVLAVIGGAAFYILTMPRTVDAAALPQHTPDVKNGEYVFNAAGCASCHAAPASEKCDDPKSKDRLVLAGGHCLRTPFGAFYVPNISPDPESGIGKWSDLDFINAMTRGVAPDGSHYFPAFPYTSYTKMKTTDLLDMKAYIGTLPPVKSSVASHDVPFPFNVRRGLGLWKMLYLDDTPVTPKDGQSAQVARGAYLVESAGHCGECHSPRNLIGGVEQDKAYAGAADPQGDGVIPNITPHEQGLGDWSEKDIVYFLETGELPGDEFDVVGGTMVKVQENMARLTPEDRDAIAAYLKSLPPHPTAVAKRLKPEGADAKDASDGSDY